MTISHVTLEIPDIKTVTYSFPGPQGPRGQVADGTVDADSIVPEGLPQSSITGLVAALAATPPGSRAPTANSVTSSTYGPDLRATLQARKNYRMHRRALLNEPARVTRNPTTLDVRSGWDPQGDYDLLHKSLHRKVCFKSTGKNRFIWLDRDMPRYEQVTSVSYYLDDADLQAKLTTPSTAAIATRTTAPFSLGGMTANNEMAPWAMTEISSWDTWHTLSLLVTYASGAVKVIPSVQIFCTQSYLDTMSNIMLALASGETDSIGPGVIDFRNSSTNFTRAALATLKATDNVIIDAVGANMASLSGSNCRFEGDYDVVGGIIVRGPDYQIDGGDSAVVSLTYPAWLAPATEGTSRVLQLDGIGGICYRPVLRNAMIGGTISDLLNISRAEDVTVENVMFGDGWDLVSNSHTDGLQTSGSLTASGNLKDSEGDAVALLVRNCSWYGTNLIDKPDLGPSGPHSYEWCWWFNSGRVGVQLQPNSVTNNVEWVKFRNCWSYGHATYDFLNTAYASTTFVPIKRRDGTILTGAAAQNYPSTEGELVYTNGTSGNNTPVVIQPAEAQSRPVSIRVADVNKPTAINGSSFSVSRAGVSGYGSTYLIYVLLADDTVTMTNLSSLGLSVVGSSASAGQGKLWVLQRANYDGTNAGPWVITLSGSTTGIALETANTYAAKGVESIVFATPASVSGGGSIVAPTVSTTGRNRQVKWIYGVIGTASASTWTKPTSVGGGTQLAATIATQANTLETSNISTTAALLEAYRPQSYKTPVGDQGTLTASYGSAGTAFACAIVLGPSEEAPPRTIAIPGLDTSSIDSRVNGLTGEKLSEHLEQIYDLASTAAGEHIDPHDFDAKGQMIVASGNDTYGVLSAGANGLVPTYDSSQTLGMKAAVPRSGLLVATSQVVFQNSTTETVVFGPLTIPSADVIAGRTYLIKMGGTVDNAASGNCTLRTRIGASGSGLGGTSFTSSGITSASLKTNQAFEMDLVVTFRANSGSAVPTVAGGLLTNSTSGTTVPIGGGTATNLNTTTDRELVITANWGGLSANNILRVEWGFAELIA